MLVKLDILELTAWKIITFNFIKWGLSFEVFREADMRALQYSEGLKKGLTLCRIEAGKVVDQQDAISCCYDQL